VGVTHPGPPAAEALNAQLAPDSICWACGPAHGDGGLGLRHMADGEGNTTRWFAAPAFEGAPGRLHNGMAAVLLEEAAGWAAIRRLRERDGRLRGVRILDLKVEYLAPVPSRVWLTVTARAEGEDGDVVATSAELLADGEVVARATSRLAGD
jgi:acyl-coenzyme A thioesterase PaaI-like protein